ncbi:MAG: toll/interleukin-1 receptor domain-containing protein [Pseudomonadota bacterium]
MTARTQANTGQNPPAAHKLKVFISYSREDEAFALELERGLKFAGEYEVLIDREDIRGGEDWRDRLRALIADADTLVFVLSPRSVKSKECRWEVEEAQRASKRVLPVEIENVDGLEVPGQLNTRHYIGFKGTASFMTGLSVLREALNTDLDWVREHTRLLARAREWDEAGRAGNRLMAGSDIAAAKAWLGSRPEHAEAPTELHHDFIHASEEAEAEKLSAERERAEALEKSVARVRRARNFAYGLFALAAGSGLFALVKQQEADHRTNQAIASLTNQAQMLTSRATDLNNRFQVTTAMLLALEALPDKQSEDPTRQKWPYLPKAKLQLYRSWRFNRELLVIRRPKERLLDLSFSQDGRHIVASSRAFGTRRWNAESGSEIIAIAAGTAPVQKTVFSPDGTRAVTVAADSAAALWNVENRAQVKPFHLKAGSEYSFTVSPDSTRLLSLNQNGTNIRLWDAGSGKPILPFSAPNTKTKSALFSADSTRVLTVSKAQVARLWNAQSGEEIAFSGGNSNGVDHGLFSPDGQRLLLVGNGDGKNRLWNAETGQFVGALDGNKKAVFSLNSRVLLTTSRGKGYPAWIWNGKTGSLIAKLGNARTFSGISPDGRHVITAAQSEFPVLWNTTGNRLEPKSLEDHGRLPLVAAKFSPDSLRVLTMGYDRKLATLRSSVNGYPRNRFLGDRFDLESLQFGPTASTIIARSKDRSESGYAVFLLDSDHSATRHATFAGHTRTVRSTAINADGSRLLTRSDDGTIRVWDLSRRLRWLNSMRGTRRTQLGSKFAREMEERFPSAQDLVDQAKADVPRCLTTGQRKKFNLNPVPPRWCYEMKKWPYRGQKPPPLAPTWYQEMIADIQDWFS